jgi:hypothetical protein
MVHRKKKKGLQNFNNILLACLIILTTSNCAKTSDPEPVNEEELITTVNVTFTNTSDPNDVIIASFEDLDGPGGNDGTITNPTFAANSTYNVQIEFLNKSVVPTDDITVEIEEEGVDHQIFYVVSSAIDTHLTYNDQDANGFPVGINCIFDLGDPGFGAMEVILVHLPIKSNSGVIEGDITNAGGDEDIHISFDVTIQ